MEGLFSKPFCVSRSLCSFPGSTFVLLLRVLSAEMEDDKTKITDERGSKSENRCMPPLESIAIQTKNFF